MLDLPIANLSRIVSEGIDPQLSPSSIVQIYYSDASSDQTPMFLAVHDGTVTAELGEHPTPDVELDLDPETLRTLELGNTNVRDPRTVSALRLAGDIALFQEIVSACCRPPPSTSASFARAETMARQQTMAAAQTLDRPTRSEFLQQMRNAIPTVLRGALDWEALQWNFHSLRERFGQCVFRPGADGGEKLAVLIDRMLAGEHVYSHGCAVPAEMRSEFRFPYFDSSAMAPMQLWIGSKSPKAVTGLHRDAHQVLLAQVIGRKCVRLYSPDQVDLLYARKAYGGYYQQCWVDPDAPEPARFPKFQDARFFDVHLHPGEVLFIPLGWFHCVYALDDLLSVSTIITNQAHLLS